MQRAACPISFFHLRLPLHSVVSASIVALADAKFTVKKNHSFTVRLVVRLQLGKSEDYCFIIVSLFLCWPHLLLGFSFVFYEFRPLYSQLFPLSGAVSSYRELTENRTQRRGKLSYVTFPHLICSWCNLPHVTVGVGMTCLILKELKCLKTVF